MVQRRRVGSNSQQPQYSPIMIYLLIFIVITNTALRFIPHIAGKAERITGTIGI